MSLINMAGDLSEKIIGGKKPKFVPINMPFSALLFPYHWAHKKSNYDKIDGDTQKK